MTAREIGKTLEGGVIYFGTDAERQAMIDVVNAGARQFWHADGSRYESNGAGGWNQTHAAGGAALILDQSAKNIHDPTGPEAWGDVVGQCRPTQLSGTGAIECAAGVLGTAGVANDTLLCGVLILQDAGPATLTITGLGDDADTAQNLVLTGSTTVDVMHDFGGKALRNWKEKFTFTASVADKVWVFTKPRGS